MRQSLAALALVLAASAVPEVEEGAPRRQSPSHDPVAQAKAAVLQEERRRRKEENYRRRLPKGHPDRIEG